MNYFNFLKFFKKIIFPLKFPKISLKKIQPSQYEKPTFFQKKKTIHITKIHPPTSRKNPKKSTHPPHNPTAIPHRETPSNRVHGTSETPYSLDAARSLYKPAWPVRRLSRH